MSSANTTAAQPEDQLQALCSRAASFAHVLEARRRELAPPGFWYPYGTMGNFIVLNRLLTGANRSLLSNIAPARAADIGAADGDVAFFLEQEGWDMTIIDNGPTNWNGLRGARLYKEAVASSVQIIEMDIDSQFKLNQRYDLVFFMGILYHLKNPFYVLEHLGQHAKYALLSTRIMRWSRPKEHADADQPRQLLEHLPLAYLLGPTECNNDATNYWIFSDAGLRRLISRTGWTILDYLIVGDADDADPFTNEHDARAFCLLESQHANS